MERQEYQMIELLKFNKGFSHPEKWIKYGIEHNFSKVRADKLEECPDCRARSLNFIGQYVYYSTLVSLQTCAQCRLVFSDTRIDPQVIQSHFERAYKDESYFKHRRRRIFEQISTLADRYAPRGGKILDIGGAKGHLLAVLKARRPDLSCVLNDLSKKACDHAASEYGFQTILGGVNELEKISSRFDLIIMSDVIYYEPELRKLWVILPRLVSENGAVIIRVPNKLALIRFWQFMGRAIARHRDQEMQDNIKFFNPEHLYIFSRRYLLMRLKKIGFSKVIATPSELLIRERGDLWHPLYYFFCKMLCILSCGRLLITPSLLIIAKNYISNENNGA
jgi:SAM-dependent methyltransferase